jgi:hypothetical protein
MDLVPNPLILRKSGSGGNRTGDLGISSQKAKSLQCPLHTRKAGFKSRSGPHALENKAFLFLIFKPVAIPTAI